MPAMNIVVCVKQVPDTEVERTLKPGEGTLDRDSVDGVINVLDEYAIEEGLKIAETHGGEVTILSMGPDKAAESIRKALSMGPDKAVHLVDDALAGSDALSTSLALAEALKLIGFDLVICGSESTDASTGILPAMLAERLGVPQLTLASKVEIDGSSVTIRRASDDGYAVVTGSLGASRAVTDAGWGTRTSSRSGRPARPSPRSSTSRSGRHTDLQDHHRHQQGRRGPDLRGRRFRRGR